MHRSVNLRQGCSFRNFTPISNGPTCPQAVALADGDEDVAAGVDVSMVRIGWSELLEEVSATAIVPIPGM